MIVKLFETCTCQFYDDDYNVNDGKFCIFLELLCDLYIKNNRHCQYWLMD